MPEQLATHVMLVVSAYRSGIEGQILTQDLLDGSLNREVVVVLQPV